MKDRSTTISRLKQDREFRSAYISGKLKVLIPAQIKALRLKSTLSRQEDLADAAEMLQSRISAIETPGAVNFNLETLVRIASALKVGLAVKFVSFNEMLKWENEFRQDSFSLATIDNDLEFHRQDATTSQDSRLASTPNFGTHIPETDSSKNVSPQGAQLWPGKTYIKSTQGVINYPEDSTARYAHCA